MLEEPGKGQSDHQGTMRTHGQPATARAPSHARRSARPVRKKADGVDEADRSADGTAETPPGALALPLASDRPPVPTGHSGYNRPLDSSISAPRSLSQLARGLAQKNSPQTEATTGTGGGPAGPAGTGTDPWRAPPGPCLLPSLSSPPFWFLRRPHTKSLRFAPFTVCKLYFN